MRRETDRDMMNKYASQIRDRWLQLAPTRYKQLENPELFFEELGQLTLSRVDELASSLQAATPASSGETYLETAARLSALNRQAEELAMSELDWPEVELTSEEIYTEWRATSSREESLLEWASYQEEVPADEELEALSAEWMMSVEFLLALATSTNPWTFSAEHSETMTLARKQRFERYLAAK